MEQELGLLGKRNYYRNLLKTYSCFIVGAQLNVRVENERLIKDVAQKLFESRKNLRINVFEQDGKLITREIKTTMVEDLVEFKETSETSELTEVLNDLHETTFELKVEKPTWKIFFIDFEWVMVLCDHTLYDGTTGALILEDFLTILNQDEPALDRDIDDSKFQELISPSYSYTAQKVLQVFAPKWCKLVIYWLFNSGSKFERPDSGWVNEVEKKRTFRTFKKLISINKKDFTNLKHLLASHDVKFTAFWVYLNIEALSRVKPEDMEISIPCNLRSFLPSEFHSDYGLFVSHASLYVAHTDGDNSTKVDWDYVKYINSEITENKLRKSAELIGMLKLINPKDALENAIISPRSGTFELSNLGLRKRSKHNWKYSFNEYVFSQPNCLTGTQITNSAISSTEKVNIILDGAPETEEFFEQYTQNLRKLLDSIIDVL